MAGASACSACTPGTYANGTGVGNAGYILRTRRFARLTSNRHKRERGKGRKRKRRTVERGGRDSSWARGRSSALDCSPNLEPGPIPPCRGPGVHSVRGDHPLCAKKHCVRFKLTRRMLVVIRAQWGQSRELVGREGIEQSVVWICREGIRWDNC